MQTLCPTFYANCRPRHVLGRVVAFWTVTLWMLVHTLSVSAQNQVTTPLQSLELQAKQWAAQQPNLRGKDLSVAPIDPRITVQNCQQLLQFDQPFPGQTAVRVRCMLPSWQLFINLAPSGQAGAGPARPNGAAGPPVTQKVLVAKEILKRGTVLSPGMFTVTEQPPAGMETQLIQDPALIANMELVRDLLPGTPLRTYDVKNAVMVKRGQEVLVTAGAGQGFLITVKAEAQQDAGMGETIRLKNAESGRFMSAEVTGPGTAKMK
jgi:flagella basal body P-ring formation protein FlgA